MIAAWIQDFDMKEEAHRSGLLELQWGRVRSVQ